MAADWAEFNEVRNAMAEEERELSTDEEEVVAPDRDVLLQAAADRMKREGERTNPPAQAGVHSTEFNERASSIFGGIGGAQAQEGMSLRFWTSIHASAGARTGAAAQTGAAQAGGEESEWNPLDDLDDLDDMSEEDLSQLEDEEDEGERQGGREPAARKRPQAEPTRTPHDGVDGQRTRKPRAAASVTFGADTIITLPQQPLPGDMPAPASAGRVVHVERSGYRHYSLADVDADAGSNRRAASEAMEAVRALQMSDQ